MNFWKECTIQTEYTFYAILFSGNTERVAGWLKKLDIPEIQTYVNGIRKDLDAVCNGIQYEYNNGLAEGNVNKIKVIKELCMVEIALNY